MSRNIAVIMGGPSVEREVSLVSGRAIEKALAELGYNVTPIDADHTLPAQILDCKPDVAFNALHGRFGEDGCVQGVLETLGLPYTHSGVLASALAICGVVPLLFGVVPQTVARFTHVSLLALGG